MIDLACSFCHIMTISLGQMVSSYNRSEDSSKYLQEIGLAA